MYSTIPVRVDPAVKAHVTRAGMQLQPTHPLYIEGCPVCGEALLDGPISLVYVGRCPGERWTAAAVAVHDTCTDEPAEVPA